MTSKSWTSARLGDLVNVFDGRRIPIKEADRKKGLFPYYGASGIVDWVDGFIFDGDYLLIAEDGENLRTRQTPVAFIATGKFWVNNHAHVVRANESSDTRFLCYALANTDIGGFLTGSTMPKLTQANLLRIPIDVPPLSEQHAIADILGSLDDKIELNRRMNATLEAMARALFKSWFVDFDPVRAKMDGRTPAGMDAETAALFPARLVDSELGPIPEGWRVESVGDVMECVGGSTPSTSEDKYWNPAIHAWATPKDLSALESSALLRTQRCISDDGLSKISSGLLPTGTVLMSSRAPVGYLAIADCPVAINQGFIAIRPNERLSAAFVLNWCHANMTEIQGRATGTTFAEISKSSFRAIKIIVPDTGSASAFADRVGAMYRRVAENCRESESLKALRDSLLPKLLSGELAVDG